MVELLKNKRDFLIQYLLLTLSVFFISSMGYSNNSESDLEITFSHQRGLYANSFTLSLSASNLRIAAATTDASSL